MDKTYKRHSFTKLWIACLLYTSKDLGAAGLDYHMGVIKKHPEWIKEAHDLGLKVNVWTVDKAEDMKWLIDQKVDFITTNEPTVAQEILK